MATTVARLEAVLSADTRNFDSAMGRSQTRMQRAGRAARGLSLAAGGILVAGLAKGVKEAMDAERSQVRLETAFKNAKIAIDPLRGSIEAAGKAAIQMGFDDEAATDSLGSLIIATGDYKTARGDLNVAMDLARFKSIDLESATKTLTMAMGGSQRAVKQLGIDVAPVTTEYDRLKKEFGAIISPAEAVALKQAKINDKNATAALVIDTVRQKVQGQADAYSKTASGAMEVYRAKMEELQEMMGKKVLPVLIDVVNALTKLIEKMELVNSWAAKIGANQSLIDIFKDIKAHIPTVVIETLANSFKDMWNWVSKVVSGIRWLISNIGKIPKLPNLPDLNPFDGDPRDPGGGGPTSISPRLWGALGRARGFGLSLTSGYRPGAVTANGTPSDHGTYPSKAIDVSNGVSTPQMAAFFRSLIGNRGIKQAFYDPIGSIFGGILSSYREGGHSDHVHVATYAKGGIVPGFGPQPAIVHGGETILPRGGGNITIPVSIGGEHIATVVFDMIRRKAQVFERNNGRPAFG